MTSLVVKLIVTPIGIILASWIFPNVNFINWYQPIMLGVLLAIIGHLMEVAMLSEDTNWMMIITDFAITSAIVYFGAMFFTDAFVTLWGAILTGAVIGVMEIFQHYWLLESGKLKKKDVVGG